MGSFGKKPSSSFNYYKRMTSKQSATAAILRNLDNFPHGAFNSTPPSVHLSTKQ